MAEYTFTRPDVDRLVRTMIAQRDALNAMDYEIVRDFVKPSAPWQVMPQGQLAHLAKVTGAMIERVTREDGAKWQIVRYGGAEFWAYGDKEVA